MAAIWADDIGRPARGFLAEQCSCCGAHAQVQRATDRLSCDAPADPRRPPPDHDFARSFNATRSVDRKLLIRGACILTMDDAVQDLPSGDILVSGRTIAAIAPSIDSDAPAIDGRGMIALPGFVDTHRHCWQTMFRRFAPDALVAAYRASSDAIARNMTPHDVFLGNLLSCLGALDAGITTLLDWSHISNTPEHSDAAIDALAASRIRAVYGYGHSRCDDPRSEYPLDAKRLRRRLQSDDALVTMAMAADINRIPNWALARELGLRITAHATRQPELLEEAGRAGLMRDDTTYIHCTTLSAETWKRIRNTGGSISLAVSSVAQLGVGSGLSPIQTALDLGIRPSLSIDVEACLPGDMFTQMRVALALQRGPQVERLIHGGRGNPLSVRDILEFATLEGARTLGLSHRLGSLTPGKAADILLLDAQDINNGPLNTAVGTVVSGSDPRNISAVLVDGRIAKWQGCLVDVDISGLIATAASARDRLATESGLPVDILGAGT